MVFGPQNSGQLSKADADRKRELAKQLMGSNFRAVNPLGALAMGLEGTVSGLYDKDASGAEKMGNAQVAELLAGKDYTGAMGNEWASPQQAALAATLQGRDWQVGDRNAQWAREDQRSAQARADAMAAASAPKFEMFEAGGDRYRYNANDPNSRPELFFDGPDAAPETQPLINAGNGTIFDPNAGEWITNPNAPAGGAVNFDDISGIRKEVQGLPSYKNLAQATPIYNSMVETAGRDSRASDLNLVYGLGKIMDPTSVVREGEMFMVQGINTLPDKVIEGINSVLTGTSTLSPETRQAILTEAYGRVKGYEDAYSTDSQSYKGLADRYKINLKAWQNVFGIDFVPVG